MKKIILLSALIISNVYGIDFQTARKKGLVGEESNGYISAVKTAPSAEIKNIVKTINQKRKAKFKQIATKTGAKNIGVVGKSVHSTILGKLPAGAFYKNANGSWVRK